MYVAPYLPFSNIFSRKHEQKVKQLLSNFEYVLKLAFKLSNSEYWAKADIAYKKMRVGVESERCYLFWSPFWIASHPGSNLLSICTFATGYSYVQTSARDLGKKFY